MPDDRTNDILRGIGEIQGRLGRIEGTVESYLREQTSIQTSVAKLSEKQDEDASEIHERISVHRREIQLDIEAESRRCEEKIKAQSIRCESTEKTVGDIKEKITEGIGGWKAITIIGAGASSLGALAVAYFK